VVFDVSGMSGTNSFNISVNVLNKLMGSLPVPINPFLSSVWVNIVGGFKETHLGENHDMLVLYVLFIKEIFFMSFFEMKESPSLLAPAMTGFSGME
jgi:hypothetical protein